jgi:hypothetical protein
VHAQPGPTGGLSQAEWDAHFAAPSFQERLWTLVSCVELGSLDALAREFVRSHSSGGGGTEVSGVLATRHAADGDKCRVFVSCEHLFAKIGSAIAEYLRDAGHEVFFDAECINRGAEGFSEDGYMAYVEASVKAAAVKVGRWWTVCADVLTRASGAVDSHTNTRTHQHAHVPAHTRTSTRAHSLTMGRGRGQGRLGCTGSGAANHRHETRRHGARQAADCCRRDVVSQVTPHSAVGKCIALLSPGHVERSRPELMKPLYCGLDFVPLLVRKCEQPLHLCAIQV